MAKLHCFVALGVVAAVISTVSAISEDEKNAIRRIVIPLLAECGKEFPTTKEDIIAAKESKSADLINRCFLACVMKKRGLINDDGYFDVEAAKSEHAKYIKDKEVVKQLDSVSDNCDKKVNNQTVSDGPKGCDRAKLVVDCLKDHKDIFLSIFQDVE